MKIRGALVYSLLLAPACPFTLDTSSSDGTSSGGGTGTTGSTASAGTGSATDAVPTGSDAGTGHASSGGLTEASTGVVTGETTGATGATTGETSDATTGAAACEAIVGSTDCAALVAVSPDLTLEECMTCQGAPCGQEPICDDQYPCVDGSIVLQGCCSDEQCAGLTLFCGMFIGTDNICVLSDDV